MLKLKDQTESTWDLVSLGEVMLRLDPGDDRIHNARSFRVWEGGGEYNVARNLAKCFRQRASIATAFADNQVGRLVEDLIKQGSVDTSNIVWRKTDGISRTVRNGMYFMERGFGMRAATGCSDRGNTAVSQLKVGDIDWKKVFDGARWFHTGGIFAGLSDTTLDVAAEAMQAARQAGTIVSYDLNYRDSLWSDRGGRDAANVANRRLLEFADVVFGVEGFNPALSAYSESDFRFAAERMISNHGNLKLVATTLRNVSSASRHDLSGVCMHDASIYKTSNFEGIEVLDRVGSGDAFASGLIYGLLSNKEPQASIELATAAATLSLTSPGDGLSATLAEVERASVNRDSGPIR
ncbi:MAG TPA: sugar kinase [Pyrinomonadaceae bacterium]|nr:sugar kinase [Pyrinomonadaceae bacterium]